MSVSFLAVAYRWGWTNNHSYFIYCGTDRVKALALARAENADRGGKYACVVWKFDEDGIDSHSIGYWPSSMEPDGQTAPRHNHRIDYFETLGHFLHDMADGKCLLPVEDGSNTLTYQPVECPPFARARVERERKMLAIFEEKTTT